MDEGSEHARSSRPSVEVKPLAEEVAVVRLYGEHDLSTTPELAGALDDACRRSRVLVDLSQCTFIDSTVLARLLFAHRKQIERRGRFELFLPSDPAGSVHRLIKLSKIDTLLRIHETRDNALASIQATR
jgi:anti-sigma B factor antagonist